MSREFELIPFTVREIRQQADAVPKGVKIIQAESLWKQGYTGEGVTVAVIDTGIDAEHPDLKPNIIDGYNFTSEGGAMDIQDHNGHGSHVAGTIAGADNGVGIIGVAPNTKLLVLKALDRYGQGEYRGVINAVKYAVRWRGPKGEKVRIISMSLGGPSPVLELEEAIKEAIQQGILVIVAAGNEGDADEVTYEYAYPAFYNPVVSVAATDLDNNLAPFSNNNQQVDLLAPGVDILSTWIKGRYARISGTSMATPHVAGAMSLLLEKGEKEFGRIFTESEMFATLVKHTVPLDYKRTSMGHGLLQLGYMEKVRSLINFMHEKML